ncbi:hypothetical protein LCER1_G008945, partial [Lachnellula cervina]
MSSNTKNIAIIATPTSPILPHLLHLLSHTPSYETILITRKTILEIPFTTSALPSDSHPNTDSNSHVSSYYEHEHEHGNQPLTTRPGTNNQAHNHTSTSTQAIKHIQTDFSAPDLTAHLQSTHTIICLLHGADIHLQIPIISLCTSGSLPNIGLFIPSEYGLDTGNPAIRALLPPYATRFLVQEALRSPSPSIGNKNGLRWKAIYSGLSLAESLKSDGVLGIDILWASVVWFPGTSGIKLAISSYEDIASQIFDAVSDSPSPSTSSHNSLNGNSSGDSNEEEGKGNGKAIHAAGFRATLTEIAQVVERALDKPLDRYEADMGGARREAGERMARGFVDGA